MNEGNDLIFTLLTGRSSLLELKIKLLLDRGKYRIKGKTCSRVKNMMYNEFSEYFTKEDKKSIDEAVWVRNKLIHFELHEILKKQKSIESKTVLEPVNKRNILESIKNIFKGKNKIVSEKNFLYGQYLELSSNSIRLRELKDILDKAINIITRVTDQSNKE